MCIIMRWSQNCSAIWAERFQPSSLLCTYKLCDYYSPIPIIECTVFCTQFFTDDGSCIIAETLEFLFKFWFLQYLNMNHPSHSGFFAFIQNKYNRNPMKVAWQYVNISKQLARYQQHLAFNSRCKRYSLIPTYLCVHPLVPSAEGFCIANHYSRQSFNAKISLNDHTISRLRQGLHEQFVSLGELFSESEVNVLCSFQEKAHALETSKCKIHQKAKFDCLVSANSKRGKRNIDSRWVINMPNTPLSEPELEILKKG